MHIHYIHSSGRQTLYVFVPCMRAYRNRITQLTRHSDGYHDCRRRTQQFCWGNAFGLFVWQMQLRFLSMHGLLSTKNDRRNLPYNISARYPVSNIHVEYNYQICMRIVAEMIGLAWAVHCARQWYRRACVRLCVCCIYLMISSHLLANIFHQIAGRIAWIVITPISS